MSPTPTACLIRGDHPTPGDFRVPVKLRLLRLLGTLCVGCGLLFVQAQQPEESTPSLLRFGFSSSLFGDVKENDARAAMKAWAHSLARERNVQISTEALVFGTFDALRTALQSGQIEGASVTTDEFLRLDPSQQSTNLFLSRTQGAEAENYVLLVHSGSGLNDLAALKGKSITLYSHCRASLATFWLNQTLLAQGLESADEFFGEQTRSQKLTKVVVPVFFKQQDACLVTLRGFETMAELNPQLKKQLKVLHKSQPLIPVVGFISNNAPPHLRDSLIRSLRDLEKSAAGSQILALFQSDSLHQVPPSILDETRRFFEECMKAGLLKESSRSSTGDKRRIIGQGLSPELHTK